MIRAQNLKLLLKREGWSNAHFGRLMGWTDGQYVGQLMNRRKPFTEKTARLIEEKANLPKRWLDEIHEAAEYEPGTLTDPETLHIVGESAARYMAKKDIPPNEGRELAHTSGPSDFTEAFNNARTPNSAPVIEWARLGDDLKKANYELEGCELLSVPDSASQYCKWVTVTDDHIRFGIRKGNKVAIEPLLDGVHIPVENEVYLFRSVASGKFFLAEYRSLASGAFEAIPSTGHPLDSIRHGLEIVGIHKGTWK